MSWAVIRNSDGMWLEGPLDEQPIPGEGESVVVVALGYPDAMAWSPAVRGFVDIVTAAPTLTIGRFKLLLTQAERIAIRQAAATVPEVEDFMDLLNGFTDGVSLSDPMMIAAIGQLHDAGLLTEERATAVLDGLPPA